MPRYSNDGWANLLSAVDYKNAEPERNMAREANMMKLQAMRDAKRKSDALESYRTGLDAPVTPETTQTIVNPAAQQAFSENYGEQQDARPDLLGATKKEVTTPATYLNEMQKLEKMERYMLMQGDWKSAKELNEYRKQETKRLGFHQVFTEEFQKNGMDDRKTKEALIQQYGEGARTQIENLQFTPSGVIQKNENLITPWESGKPQNLQKETAPKYPKQVIVNDDIKYVDETGGFVEGLGGKRYKPTIPKDDSKSQERADRRDAVTLRKEFNNLPEVKEYNQTIPKIKSMQSAFAEAKTTGNFVAVDQALITLFNKLTDPNSVVRESEYARTAENIPLVNQIKGKVQKVLSGGAGLTSEERFQLMNMANLMQKGYTEIRNRRLKEYQGYGTQSGLKPGFLIDSTSSSVDGSNPVSKMSNEELLRELNK